MEITDLSIGSFKAWALCYINTAQEFLLNSIPFYANNFAANYFQMTRWKSVQPLWQIFTLAFYIEFAFDFSNLNLI